MQGRTTAIIREPNGTPEVQSFTYDHESRVKSVTRNGQTVSYAYNGLDTRTSVTSGANTNHFLRDGAYVTDPVLVDSGATYTPGISERRGTTTTYLHSGLKNAFAQSGTSQNVTATREYDAFGNVTAPTGAWAGPFGYAGKFGYQSPSIPGVTTPDEGITLMGHRYYDSSTGRFLTRDPIFDGRNWYSYGGGEGNPLTGADPTGLKGIHAYILNLWRTHKDAKTIIEMLKIALGGPLNRTQRKNAEQALEWFERFQEAIEAAQLLADWIDSNGGVGTRHPNRPAPTKFRNDNNKLPRKGDYIKYDVEERPAGKGRTGPRLIIDRKSGRKWFWDHKDKYLELP